MPKRTAAVDTTLLMLELLKRIPRRSQTTAPALQIQLQDAGWHRSLRTIQRNLDQLCVHFDIERDERDRPFGYQWKARAAPFVVPALGEQESLLLTLAEQHLKPLLPVGLLKSLRPFFEQARSNIRGLSPDSNAREWASKVRVVRETQPLMAATIDPQVFEAVSVALYANRWLTVDYRNADGRSKIAQVMPLGLAQQGPRMYLVVRFEGYEDDRTLALHRILSAVPSSFSFTRPRSFSLQRYDDSGRFGLGNRQRVLLRFRIAKDAGAHLRETPLSPDQRIREYSDYLLVSATVPDTAQLTWWLNSFGDQITNIHRQNAKA